MKLRQVLELSKPRSKKRPADVFNVCPECESPNILKFDGEAICGFCNWDSLSVSFDADFMAEVDQACALEDGAALSCLPSFSSRSAAKEIA